MSKNKINRIGEVGYNKLGSKMIIIEYRGTYDIDVYFPEYNWTAKNVQYDNFKRGIIKCPYEPRVCGVGYLGEGKYTVRGEDGKQTKCYQTWKNILQRCYDKKEHKKRPLYKDCFACEEWHNFQNFAKWYYDNIYFIGEEQMHLDKDILNKGNKTYSPSTCIFVPQSINDLFTKRQNYRGKYPIGVCKHGNRYRVKCNKNSDGIYLGIYDTPEQAFQVYKTYKEKVIKQTIDSYEDIIPESHYSKLKKAMYNYKIEITD